MMHDLSRVERQHLAIQKSRTSPNPTRKRCACGAQVTAAQLARQGSCEHCRLTVGLADGDLDKLRHMLGATAHYPKSQWGFRNHYCCGVQDRAAMERLVAAGLAVRGRAELTTVYYHSTRNGCRAAGLSRAAIVRALGAEL